MFAFILFAFKSVASIVCSSKLLNAVPFGLLECIQSCLFDLFQDTMFRRRNRVELETADNLETEFMSHTRLYQIS